MEIRRRRESSSPAYRQDAAAMSSFPTAPWCGSAPGARDPRATSASKVDGKGTLRANTCGWLPGLLAVHAGWPPGPEECCAGVTRRAPLFAAAAAFALRGPPGHPCHPSCPGLQRRPPSCLRLRPPIRIFSNQVFLEKLRVKLQRKCWLV